MTTHIGTIRDVAHRMREAVGQFAPYVNEMDLPQYQKVDIRQFLDFIRECADALSPDTCAAVVPDNKVIALPRLSPVRAYVPVVALGEETWR